MKDLSMLVNKVDFLESANFEAQPQRDMKQYESGNVKDGVNNEDFEDGVDLYATTEEWVYLQKHYLLI